MLLQKNPRGRWRQLKDRMLAPISPRNLRMSALLIAIYQLLIAHILVFVVLLCLAHAEQMKTMLALDIEDQKEYGFYDLTPFTNQMRLKTASQLASVTEVLLYIATTISIIYLVSCLSLFAGVFKNRSQLILPWLIVDFVFIIMSIVTTFWCESRNYLEITGSGRIRFFIFSATLITFNSLIWYIVNSFYQSLRTMNKLTEIATVAIPCPAPGVVPFQFRRENMYLGSNGYKHILSDEAPEGNN